MIRLTTMDQNSEGRSMAGAFAHASYVMLAGAVVAAALFSQSILHRPTAPAVPVAPLPEAALPHGPAIVAPVEPAVVAPIIVEAVPPRVVEVAPVSIVTVGPTTRPMSYQPSARDTYAVEPAPRAAVPAAKAKFVPETPESLRPAIARAAARYGIPTEVLSAALARESANFKPKYIYGYHVDGTGRGVAGIDKQYWPNVSDEQAFDPNFAVDWMGQFLGNILKKNGGSVYNALREYNGGPNFASNRAGYQGRTVNELTRTHADAIMAHAARAIA